MTATTHAATDPDGFQSVTTPDGLNVHGTPRVGWHVARADGVELAHYLDPSLGPIGALRRFRQQQEEAKRSKDE